MALSISFNDQSKRVRVSPATTMLDVVEAARTQFGLDTSRQYELTHRGRPVDLSIPFRLTGISNNASLELRVAVDGDHGNGRGGKTAVQSIRVCVQTAEGKRVQQSFGTDQTLERILVALQLIPSAGEFSLTYLQREIEFASFASLTLQGTGGKKAVEDLGIVSGSAMFRVKSTPGSTSSSVDTTPTMVQRAQSPTPQPAPTVRAQQVEPVVPPTSSPSLPTPPPATLMHNPPGLMPSTSVVVPVPSSGAASRSIVHEEDVEMKSADEESVQTGGPMGKPLSSHEALQVLRDSVFDAVARPAILTLMKIVTNLLSYPENDKLRSIRVSNPAFDRNVGQHRGGIEFLLSIGFENNADTGMLTLSWVETTPESLQIGLRVLQDEADDIRIEESERPKMQPRGPSATDVLVDNLKAKEQRLLGIAGDGNDTHVPAEVKPARNTKIMFPGQAATPSAVISSDDAVDRQPSDAALVMASMKARREEMEKAQNFRTKAMRELDELKRKRVFQSALIRVQFPDRVTLQAAFHPAETVADVIAHVRECLDDSLASHSFRLYVSPPRHFLVPEEKKTLSDLSLVPAAHTYLSWVDAPSSESESSIGWYLREDLLTSEQAESKDMDAGAAYPKPIALDEQATTDAASKRATAAAAASKRAGGGDAKPNSKKPAWFKL